MKNALLFIALGLILPNIVLAMKRTSDIDIQLLEQEVCIEKHAQNLSEYMKSFIETREIKYNMELLAYWLVQ
jgi:hypothetical protein